MWVPNRPLTTRHVNENRIGPDLDFTHRILRIELKTGEIFAVDLSGAQYGYRETVMPWISYLQSRLGTSSEDGVELHPLGKTLEITQVASAGPGLFGIIMRLSYDYAQVVNAAYTEFDQHCPLEQMFKLPQKEFERKRDQLLSSIAVALKNYNGKGENGGGQSWSKARNATPSVRGQT